MTSRDYLNTYIERHGGVPQTARFLGLPYSTLASIVNGTRGVTPKMARRMAEADPILDPNRLVWIRAKSPTPSLPNNALPICVPNGEHPVRDANDRDHVLGAGRSK